MDVWVVGWLGGCEGKGGEAAGRERWAGSEEGRKIWKKLVEWEPERQTPPKKTLHQSGYGPGKWFIPSTGSYVVCKSPLGPETQLSSNACGE